jgi:Fe-S-cluster containining protein
MAKKKRARRHVPVRSVPSAAGPVVCTKGCAACCDPVALPYTQDEARRLPLDADTRAWVLNDLVPMTRKEALRRQPWLAEIIAVSTGGALPVYFECRHLDRAAMRCSDYDNRPRPCRDYPWDDLLPKPGVALPPSCAFRADIGLPVEPVVVHR